MNVRHCQIVWANLAARSNGCGLVRFGMRERARYLERELAALKIIGETKLVTLKGKGEAELEALKRNEEAYVTYLEQFYYTGLYQVSTQSWASGSPDPKVILKDAEWIGPVGYQAKIWHAAIPGLTQTSIGGSVQDRVLRMFIKRQNVII